MLLGYLYLFSSCFVNYVFGPLFDEMLSTIDIPEFNPKEFARIFTQCLYNNTINSLAKEAYINSAMHTPRKKWYEYDY
jgi:hypothetical protein